MSPASSNHLIRSSQHIRWNRKPDLLGGFQIDYEFKFRRLLDGEIFRFCSFKNLIDVGRGAAIKISNQRTVSHESDKAPHSPIA